MNSAKMDRILDQLTPEELAGVLWMIDVLERGGMPLAEADEWRLRLLARQRFLKLDGTAAVDA